MRTILSRLNHVGCPPFPTTQTYAVEFPGACRRQGRFFAPLFHAKGGDVRAPPSTASANYTLSFLHLTLVSIATDIQWLGNALA
jgi:hypothetical protein